MVGVSNFQTAQQTQNGNSAVYAYRAYTGAYALHTGDARNAHANVLHASDRMGNVLPVDTGSV